MLASLKEIKKYVDISSISALEIKNKLTSAGIEVEEVKKLSNATNLVIGKVIECHDHPNSDHLHVCKVDVGDEVLNIVCGAPNVRENLKVIVAKVGANLNGKIIQKGEIRGVESCGMLCALNELGVDPKYLTKEQIEGIEELKDDAEIGNTNVLEYLGLDDEILDISLLANRSDCYGLFSCAKEIGALFNLPVIIPSFSEKKTYEDSEFKVGSETPNCPLFYGKIFKGIEVKESPKWLKDILRNEGIRSINNLVDLGNYIMFLTNQPIHLYDYDLLSKKELIVKDNIEEKFIGLDEKEYEIKQGDLCVTTDSKTMCLAGILGGEFSEIRDNSKNIVLEVANFDFHSIRKTSSRLGLSSESSLRFSKGINKDQSEEVINLFTEYLTKVSKVEEISNIIKYDTFDHKKTEILCSKDYINDRLGSNFSYDEIKSCLVRLNFEIIDIDGNNFKCIVPSSRIDVTEKCDLSEEVIRFYGFDKITSSLPYMETTLGKLSSLRETERLIEDYLVFNSFYEVLNYTLISKDMNESFNYLNKKDVISIFNPLSEDHKYIRRNLISSLLQNVEYNVNHQNDNFNIFEISNVYSNKNEEETHLGLAMEGDTYSKDKIFLKKKDIFDMKAIFENILYILNIDNNRIKYKDLGSDELLKEELHPYRSKKILLDNKEIGVIGELHPSIKNKYSLKKESLILMEINLSKLNDVRSSNNRFKEISRYPSVKRDFAFIVSSNVSYGDIKLEVKKSSSLIKEVNLFDIYKDKTMKEDEVSFAISITLNKQDSTLNDTEINECILKVKDTLINKFKVKFRG